MGLEGTAAPLHPPPVAHEGLHQWVAEYFCRFLCSLFSASRVFFGNEELGSSCGSVSGWLCVPRAVNALQIGLISPVSLLQPFRAAPRLFTQRCADAVPLPASVPPTPRSHTDNSEIRDLGLRERAVDLQPSAVLLRREESPPRLLRVGTK